MQIEKFSLIFTIKMPCRRFHAYMLLGFDVCIHYELFIDFFSEIVSSSIFEGEKFMPGTCIINISKF